MVKKMCGDAICGGGHRSHEWTPKEIHEHEPCIDCYCGIPFKRKGDVNYKYNSCTQPIGEFCKKHQLRHRECEPARIERQCMKEVVNDDLSPL